MAKRRKRGKGQQQKPHATTFPVNLFFAMTPQLMPALIVGCAATLALPAQQEMGGPFVFWSLVALTAGLALLRLPSVIRTSLFDGHVVLGPEILHIPTFGFFRFSPRDIPFADIESISTARESGSSTRIILTMRDGSQVVFPASYVHDYPTVVKAIERRV